MLHEVSASNAQTEQARERLAFTQLVRDALNHLHDLPHLQRHQLARLLRPKPGRVEGGKALQAALTEAIESMRPARGVAADSRLWRRHSLLTLRYLEGVDADKAAVQLGISRSELFRDQRLAVEAVASLLWGRWGMGGEKPEPARSEPVQRDDAEAASRTDATSVGRLFDLEPVELPVPWTSFVGREVELDEVRRLLATSRLLTLTGAGGCGKTRLALEAARGLHGDYAGAIAFVDLAPLGDPTLVPNVVARALGIREQSAEPVVTTLRRRLRDRVLLLVLDNCEHVVEACARLADDLLRACPGLTILATSREGLRLAGEVVWRVPSLGVPPLGSSMRLEIAAGYGAVSLFVDRARAVEPGFELTRDNVEAVAEICRRLDGIPLALELAAPLVRVLSVGEVSRRLVERFALLTDGDRAAPPRQQTLRATLEWSYQLLDDAERLLLARLSVFVGPFSLASAEAVCAGDGLEAGRVLGVLARLVDKSMMTVAPATDGSPAGAYRLLETVRHYAWDRLVASGQEILYQRRHAEHYLALVTTPAAYETRYERWNSWSAKDWPRISAIRAAYGNTRAALGWLGQNGEVTLALRLAAELWIFWIFSGLGDEGLAHLTRLLVLPAPPEAALERARALNAAANLSHWGGRHQETRSFLEESLTLFRSLGQSYGIGHTLMTLGKVARIGGDYTTAARYIEEARPLLEGIGDKFGLGWAAYDSGEIAFDQDDLDLARHCYEEASVLWRGLNDAVFQNVRLKLGFVEYYEGNHAAARVLWEGMLLVARTESIPADTRLSLCLLGLVDVAEGDYAAASSHISVGLSASVDAGADGEILRSLTVAAELAAARGEAERGARLLGAVAGFREKSGLTAIPVWRALEDRWLSPARKRLEAEASPASWAEGRAMSLEQTVEYALAGLEG